MQLAHLIERFLLANHGTTIGSIIRQFRISEERCREELAYLRPFGVEVASDGRILVLIEDR